MTSGIMTKIKNFVGLSNYMEDEDENELLDDLYRETEYTQQCSMETEVNRRQKPNNLKVVNHPNVIGHEVMVIEPRAFEETLELINHLRDRKTIVTNLHLLDREQSQRVVDFLSGATHAIDGHQQRIGEGVFIFTPPNVAISSESDKSKAIRDAFWNTAQQD